MYKPSAYAEALVAKYYEEVKPSIEEGNLELALIQMGSAMFPARERKREIFFTTHFGGMFLAAGELLEREIEAGDISGIKIAQRHFEAYAGQIRVPGSTH